jgi:hypothetical protein
MEAQDLSGLDLPDVPVGTTFDQRLNLMFDMIALAYQANLTRVFTFMMAAEGSNTPYTHIGVSERSTRCHTTRTTRRARTSWSRSRTTTAWPSPSS